MLYHLTAKTTAGARIELESTDINSIIVAGMGMELLAHIAVVAIGFVSQDGEYLITSVADKDSSQTVWFNEGASFGIALGEDF